MTIELPAKVFNKVASKEMKQWDFQSFKKTHPTLFGAIIKSMDEYGSRSRELADLVSLMDSYFKKKDYVLAGEHTIKVSELDENLGALEDKIRKKIESYARQNKDQA